MSQASDIHAKVRGEASTSSYRDNEGGMRELYPAPLPFRMKGRDQQRGPPGVTGSHEAPDATEGLRPSSQDCGAATTGLVPT